MPKNEPTILDAVPEGRRPEEFLNDAKLAEYHAARLNEAKADDPARDKLAKAASMADRAARMTAEV